MRRGLWAPEASAPGWFDVTSYSEAAWFDEEAAFQPSIGGAASLPHLSMLLEGSYVLDGAVPVFQRTYTLVLYDATLRATRFMPLAAGSYTWTGVAATLSRTSVNASRNPAPLPSLGLILDYRNVLTGSAGSYAISGAATLKAGRILTAAAGSYSWTGIAATLTKVGAGSTPQYPAPLPHIGLIMAPGSTANSVSYPAPLPSLSSIMGRASGTYAMNGSPGVYTWSGNAATFAHGYKITADTGAFVTDFSRVARDYQITCNATSYTLTGNAATIGRVFTLTCSAGSFTVTGIDAAFRYEQPGIYVLTGLAGTFTWTGSDAAFAGGTRTLTAEPGSFLIGGIAASYLLNGVAPSSAPTSGVKHKKRRQFLEVEGERFEVRDMEHAAEILAALREVATQAIDKAKAVPKVKAPKAPPELQSQVDATNEFLAQLYAEIAAQIEEQEIAELMEQGVL